MVSDLAFELAKADGRVAVITSRQRYDAPQVRLAPRESVGGVEIYRVWTSRFGRFNLVGRAIDYLTFYLSAAWRLWRLARRGDVVIAKTDPPMLSVVAAPICRWRGAKLVNWLQDIFPEVAEALGVGTGPMSRTGYGALRALRNRSLKAAAHTVAIGDRMASRLEEMGLERNRIAIIHNWADGALVRPVAASNNALRGEWGLSHRFVVGYSGNLGRAHEYKTLLQAISVLEARPMPAASGNGGRAEKASGDEEGSARIVWLFIGGGAQYEGFKHEVQARGLTSVMFQPYQPRERLAESLSAADVHLVSLRPELEGLIVPSKFYGIAAAGRPTIFIGDEAGEIARILARHRCGLSVPQGSGAALAEVVRELADNPDLCAQMGSRARALLEAAFDKAVAVGQWRTLLSTVDGSAAISLSDGTRQSSAQPTSGVT